MTTVGPPRGRYRRKPPPPRLPALESVTASAYAAATMASAALPPASSIFTPARVAFSSTVTTMPLRLATARLPPGVMAGRGRGERDGGALDAGSGADCGAFTLAI